MNNIIKYADSWFRLHNIPTIIEGDKMYILNGHFEFELSTEEINYRAECYLNWRNRINK